MDKETPFKKAEQRAMLVEELRQKIKSQLDGRMDFVRARAYWSARLPELDTALLAEALAYALDNTRHEQDHRCCQSRIKQ